MINFNSIKKIHFVGIKGVGMAGLALIASQMGKTISGSDVDEKFITDDLLASAGIFPEVGFDPKRVEGVDLVIATGAHHGANNSEARHAKELGIPMMMYATAVGLIAQNKKVIAVSGTHGKTTTTAMLSWILKKANLNPSYIIGTSEIAGLGFSSAYDTGEYFVIEADEYMTCPETDPTPKFLYLDPEMTIITNIEHDHPDRYKTIDDVKEVFARLCKNTKGKVYIGSDSVHARFLIKDGNEMILGFGENEGSDFQITDVISEYGETNWKISDIGNFTLHLPGIFNIRNATAAILLAKEIGIPLEHIQDGISSFRGTKRRFEFKGERGGVKYYDDYAHHPTEIRATLQGAREWFPDNRIIAVFQPHTFSRTRLLFDEFAESFTNADVVLLAPIFASAREPFDSDITSEMVAAKMSNTNKIATSFDSLEGIRLWLFEHVKSGDVVITLGAGNVYEIYKDNEMSLDK